MMASGGAGPQAAQFIANKGAEAVITGNVGPNAASSLVAAGIKIFVGARGTVKETISLFKNGQLQEAAEATVASHSGMGGGMGRGMGGSGRDQGRER
jgi:predicted Fe-Mo cluster-binding NifX family protein